MEPTSISWILLRGVCRIASLHDNIERPDLDTAKTQQSLINLWKGLSNDTRVAVLFNGVFQFLPITRHMTWCRHNFNSRMHPLIATANFQGRINDIATIPSKDMIAAISFCFSPPLNNRTRINFPGYDDISMGTFSSVELYIFVVIFWQDFFSVNLLK